MDFRYGKMDWNTMERGQENCYLCANGLGGFSSLTMLGSQTRNDHALLMACTKAPVGRYHMVSRFKEVLEGSAGQVTLSSQQYVNHTQNEEGFQYLNSFSVDLWPEWNFQAGGIAVKKDLVMKYGKNCLAVRYQVCNREQETAYLTVTPYLQFVEKGAVLSCSQAFETTERTITSNGLKLHYATNGEVILGATSYTTDYYYAHDARDGRYAVGTSASTHEIRFCLPAGSMTQCMILYSMEEPTPALGLVETVEAMFEEERIRMKKLEDQAGFSDEMARLLVRSSDRFLVNRESTGGKTIIAGYPFFGDWGRDTMIAMVGICISTKRYDETKNIFRTFIKYLHKGLMPNMFPEDGNEPIYNTVDASLLFIAAVNEYYQASGDLQFVREAWPAMEEIAAWYQRGTDFAIQMEEDGLLSAGSGFDQVTWMDVRVGEILPTPRHGKPVEINAYWYHALNVLAGFGDCIGERKKAEEYHALAGKVRKSFREKFWNEEENCLFDTLPIEGMPSATDRQVRCNQIWAVSLPTDLLEEERQKLVVDKVYAQLFTPYGLRSLSLKDSQFHPVYKGSQFQRDLAYHQGTVWGFLLGGFYLAYLKVYGYKEEAVRQVREWLSELYPCLREGCSGQIAEIYDGLTPGPSRGCFAQAWSVGELLRVFDKIRL